MSVAPFLHAEVRRMKKPAIEAGDGYYARAVFFS